MHRLTFEERSSWRLFFFSFFFFSFFDHQYPFFFFFFLLDLSFDIDLLPPSLGGGEDTFSGTATFSLRKFLDNERKDAAADADAAARKKFPAFDIWIPIHARGTAAGSSSGTKETSSSRESHNGESHNGDGRWIGALRVCVGKMYVSDEEETL